MQDLLIFRSATTLMQHGFHVLSVSAWLKAHEEETEAFMEKHPRREVVIVPADDGAGETESEAKAEVAATDDGAGETESEAKAEAADAEAGEDADEEPGGKNA